MDRKLMEVTAGSGEAPQKWGQIHQMLGDKVSGLALTLPFAVDAQQLGVQHFASLTLDQVRPEDDVDGACFVFNGNEDRAVGRAGPLPHRDNAASARQLPVAIAGQRGGGGETHALEPCARLVRWKRRWNCLHRP